MFCNRCGHAIASNVTFCPGCGAPVGAAPPAGQAQGQAAQPQYAPQYPQQPPPQQYAQQAPPPPPPPAYGQQPGYGAPPPPPAYGGYAAPYGAAPQYGYPGVRYAGFWRRFLAYLIDGLIFGVIYMVIFLIVGGLGAGASASGAMDEGALAAMFGGMFLLIFGVVVVGGWLYFAMLESSSKQGTLGKMAIGIKVTDLQGNRLSFGRATGRFFSKIVTQLIPLGIGWMLAGWTQKKQAIHDMIAGTLVVCK